MEHDNTNLRRFARRMRRQPTAAEQALWALLRNRRLVGFKFRRQHPFGPYILDFYCPRANVVVEADGDTHATPEGRDADGERDRFLAAHGVAILRFWNVEIADDPDGVIEHVANVCADRAGQLPRV